MTMAEAIAQFRTGEPEGLAELISYTAPGVWLAVSLLCGRQIGRTMTEIYRRAAEQSAALHSPSDLRLWLCGIVYPILLEQDDQAAVMNGKTANDVFFRMLSTLPREERTAVLLLCGEGCTAAQCAQILDRPAIEFKRAMRRARTALAERARGERCFMDDMVNTAWILKRMQELRRQTAQQKELFAAVTHCVQDGTEFAGETAASGQRKTRGYFQKLFHSTRFG